MPIGVLFFNLGPYHLARLQAAHEAMPVLGLAMVAQSGEYPWEMPVPPAGLKTATLFDHESKLDRIGATRRRLSEIDAANGLSALAVPAWSNRTSIVAAQWANDRGLPVVCMSESSEFDEPRSAWKEFIKRQILGLASSALVGGRLQAEYLVKLGMARDRVFLGYNAVDNDYFARRAAEARSQKSEVRSQYGLPDHYFLASARFIEKKNLHRVIRAYARYRQLALERGPRTEDRGQTSDVGGQRLEDRSQKTEDRGPSSEVRRPLPSAFPWRLVLLGDGPQRSDLSRLISDLRLADSVFLPGFKQYDELPAYYGLAGAFIHASTSEQWGLVVNEAMASGLPVLVSNRCGCAPELVVDGENGFTFDPDNTEQLAHGMLRLEEMAAGKRQKSEPETPEDFALRTPHSALQEMGRRSSEIITAFSPVAFARGLQQAVDAALIDQRPRAGVVKQLVPRLVVLYPFEHRSPLIDAAAQAEPKDPQPPERRHTAVRQLYDQTAENYSQLFLPKHTGRNFEFRKRLAIVSEMADGVAGQLLDCAVGSGEVTSAVLRTGRFTEATLLDISEPMLELARQQIRRLNPKEITEQIRFVRQDVFQFIKASSQARFNLVLCLGLIAHTGRLTELLKGLRRLVAAGGMILLQSTLAEQVFVRIVRATTARRYERRHGYPIASFRQQDIFAAARQAGLEIVAVRRYLVGFPFGDAIWPAGNYYLEKWLEPQAQRWGSEAIFALTPGRAHG